jgi:membrane-bound serine protease (ClpP class)
MSSLSWSIILLMAALGVICIEMFVPSAGLLAILSGTLLVSCLILAFMHSLLAGVLMTIAIGLILPIMFILFINVWPNTPIGKRILLNRLDEDDVKLKGEHYDEQLQLIGKTGIAKSAMIPSGQILIEGRKYDAVSEGLPIDVGDHVKVVAIRMFKIFVRKIDPQEAAVTSSSLEDDDILSQPMEDVFED